LLDRTIRFMPKRAKNYDEVRRKFIIWLASPEEDRLPLTQRGFAREHEIDEATLSDWKTPALMKKVNDLVDKHLADDYAKGVAALKREMAKGSFQHLRLYFEMIGKYIPRSDLTSGGEPIKLYGGFTPEDV
jgi:hypothetical protein